MQIQGSAADVVRMAMILIDEQGLDLEYGCHMLLQIHDELLFECPVETGDICMPIIEEIMEHSLPSQLAVPLTVSKSRTKNWAQAK
jgi:DNA polymerase-1